MLVNPGSSHGEPNSTSRPRLCARLRRNAPASICSTNASMVCSVFFTDNAPQRVTRSANAASNAAIAAASMINAVRDTSMYNATVW